MSKIKILIADDNLVAANKLFDKLSEYEDFELISFAKDGYEAIELIEKERPDVVMLDIIMPKLDGIGVLEYAKTLKENRPVFIIFSAISHENYISKAMKLGANYYIIKPFDEDVIASRIRQLFSDTIVKQYVKIDYQNSTKLNKITIPDMPNKTEKPKKNNTDDELRFLATKYMREYGLKPHMTGYCYIRDIIIVAFDCYCKTGTLPKGVYRVFASNNNVSIQKVERAIRNCIENVKGDNLDEKKPTNSQVICQLMQKIRVND